MDPKPNIEHENANLGPLLAQANLDRMRGNWNEAVEICVQVLRAQPGNADAHSLLGDIYRDQGAIDDAVQWYRMATDLRPNGADAEKLRKLEELRELKAAQTGPLAAAADSGGAESARGGTTQLMGYSPKRWLNTMTIVSACFLTATILVLFALRGAGNGRGIGNVSSRPTMPTAESSVVLPHVDPNRPQILPPGEQPRTQERPHQTGEGLPPDRTGNSPTTALPPLPSKTSVANPVQNTAGQQTHELPPATVKRVQPIESTMAVSGTSAESPPARQPDNRNPSDEREPLSGPDTEKPAPLPGAGTQIPNSGGNSPER